MRIVVNHLTRMHHGHVCVAGVDPDTDRHVRPAPPWGAVTHELLGPHGGVFDMANVVDLGATSHRPKRPHVEDHVFRPAHARLLERFGPEEFWALLYRVSRPTLREIFGDDLRSEGRAKCVTDPGRGRVSLGCLRPRRKPQLAVNEQGPGKSRLVINLSDGQFDVSAPVVDLRLFEDDFATPDRAAVERVRRRLRISGAVILSVGLTREYAPSPGAAPLHWLQVTNIHLEEDPTWQLG